MATPTVIGTNTWPIRISDVATDATDPGKFAWYIKGSVNEIWDTGLIGAYETGDDIVGATTFGQFKWTGVIKNVVVKTKANMDLIKRAFRYWNDNDSDLWFQNEFGETPVDEGYWSNDTWAAADQKIRCKLVKVAWKSMTDDARVCDLLIMRVTDV